VHGMPLGQCTLLLSQPCRRFNKAEGQECINKLWGICFLDDLCLEGMRAQACHSTDFLAACRRTDLSPP
jgi:hypothetical protein